MGKQGLDQYRVCSPDRCGKHQAEELARRHVQCLLPSFRNRKVEVSGIACLRLTLFGHLPVSGLDL
jgi:hypothetical protein